MTELPVPKANAMLICDAVITDKGTNKKSLIGVFELKKFSVKPMQINKFPKSGH